MSHQAQLFAVTTNRPQPLAIPKDTTDLNPIYETLSLGVYSSLRTFDHNKFLWLDDHLTRTVSSMRRLGWTYEWDETKVRHALHEVCTASPAPEMKARIDILTEPAHTLGTDSRVLIGLTPFTPLPAEMYETGVNVAIAQGLHRDDPLSKTADFVVARKGYIVDTKETYEQLLLDGEDRILEGLSSNFYGVMDGVLYTAGEGVLEGITRKIILDLATQLGIRVTLAAPHVDDIPRLTEAAISSSSRALLPVVTVNSHPIGNGRPGPICQQILAAYDAFVASEIKTAID
ncbi:MAG: aminotransferase class IV [Chloroflexota bacterium]